MENSAVKGILKSGASSTHNTNLSSRTAKFDEVNILATFHPAGKDYGHMIIDEPKTPFVFEDEIHEELDMNELLEKLRATSRTQMPSFGFDDGSDGSSSDDEYPESMEERVRRVDFDRRRKLHYKEFFSVPLARRLIDDEFTFSNSTDVSISSERTESMGKCEEFCPSFGEPSSSLGDSSFKSKGSEDKHVYLEPGVDPKHPCYQKLRAQIPQSSPGTPIYSSLTRLLGVPTIPSEPQYPKVPHTSRRVSKKMSNKDLNAPPRICTAKIDAPNPSKKKGNP